MLGSVNLHLTIDELLFVIDIQSVLLWCYHWATLQVIDNFITFSFSTRLTYATRYWLLEKILTCEDTLAILIAGIQICECIFPFIRNAS